MFTILSWYAVIMVSLSTLLLVVGVSQRTLTLVSRLRHWLGSTAGAAHHVQVPDGLSASTEAASA